MKFQTLTLLLEISLILFLFPGVDAFTYDITYFIKGTSGTSTTTNTVPFFTENADITTLNLNARSSFNLSSGSSNFNYTATYSSPFGTTIATATSQLTQNISCHNIGTSSINYTSGVIEYRNAITTDAENTSTIYTQAHFLVQSSDRFLRVFSSINNDTETFVPNIYLASTCTATSPTPTTGEITGKFVGFSDCGNTADLVRFPRAYTPAGGCGGATRKEYAYMIINTTTGVLNYSIAQGAPALGTGRFVYFPLDNPAAVTDLGTGTSKSGSLTLAANRLFVFGYGVETGSDIPRVAPTFNLTIDIGTGDFVCPPFGDCIDGFTTRTCIDANGLQPDRIENNACSLIILQNATLGFEEFETVTDVMKCNPQWLTLDITNPFCQYTISNISVDRPLNWTVVDPALGKQYFASMTRDWSTEGSRSLKMWTIPPKLGEPISVSTCGNITQGRIPQINQSVSNTTFTVNHAVSFPATNMLLSFDVAKCNEQVLQHSALIDAGFLFNVSLCAERCYAESCDTEPKGRYAFNIQDLNTSTSLFSSPFFGESATESQTLNFDLTGLGIVPGVSYNIVFAVTPENLNDRSGNCVMFDNVKYEVLQNPFIDLVPDCESLCIGNDFFDARRLPTGSCQVIRHDFSPNCLEPDIAAIVAVRGSFCDDDNTFNFFNNETRKRDQTLNSAFCIEQAAEEEAVDPSTEPVSGEDMLLELMINTATRLFWAFLFTATVFIIVLVGTAKIGKPQPEAAGIMSLFVMFYFMAIGWMPVALGVLITAIVGLWVLHEFRKPVG